MTLFFQTLSGSNEDNMGAEPFGPEALGERGRERWIEAGKGERVKGFGKHEVSVSRVKPV